MDIDKVLNIVRDVIEAHFQECEHDGIKYLTDTDHETIDDLMEEMFDTCYECLKTE